MPNKPVQVGVVKELYYYPVKSMRGIAVDQLGIKEYGVERDRSYTFKRANSEAAFPWFTPGHLPQLLLYQPYFAQPAGSQAETLRVRTPGGQDLPIESDTLQKELSQAFGSGVYLDYCKEGTFAENPVSIISTRTIDTIGQQLGAELEIPRFRPNILVESLAGEAAFPEESWLGGILEFGREVGAGGVRLSADKRDVRCVIVDMNPANAAKDRTILKTVSKTNQSCAGIYASVQQPGLIKVGDPIWLSLPAPLED